MIDMTYDPEADAMYMYMGSGKFDHTEEAGPFIYEVHAEGRILGIEILFVSTVPARAGSLAKARMPSADAAE